MKTKKSFKYTVSDPRKIWEILNEKAIEKGCKTSDNHAIFCNKYGDERFTDADGYDHSVGHRVHPSGENYEFHIVNSYNKYNQHQAQKQLTINND